MGKRRTWQTPWGYREGFVIAFGLMIIGFLLQFTLGGKGVELPSFPGNLYIGLSFTIVSTICFYIFRQKPIIKFLTGIAASISTMVVITALVIVMGFFPQDIEGTGLAHQLGLFNITNSYAFFFLFIYFTSILWLISLKRLIPFKKKNIGFLLNHFGLWLVVFAGSLGASDLQRLSIDLYENNKKLEWRAMDEKGKIVELPIAFKLIDFKLEEYAPKIGLVNNHTGALEHQNSKGLFKVDAEGPFKFADFAINVEEYLPSAGRIGNRYEPVVDLGTPHAAKIKASNTTTNKEISGWITCGSFTTQPEALRLNDDYSLIMLYPESKRFVSDLEIYTKSGLHDTLRLEVNKPIKLEGYEIYQLSYNSELGKWSNQSTLELVKDPWLPFVYTGLFLLLAGAVYMFWIGKNFSKN